MSCQFHQEKPKDQFCRHCDSGEHAIHEASRIDWINRCPSCKGSDINTNEVGGYRWCGKCGARSSQLLTVIETSPPSSADTA
jgi:hypothetical protein